MGFFDNKGKGKCKLDAGADSFRAQSSPLENLACATSGEGSLATGPALHAGAPCAIPLAVPRATVVAQCQPPHRWHVSPHRIPVPTVPRSLRAHPEEVLRHRTLLTPEQHRDLAYAPDSPN